MNQNHLAGEPGTGSAPAAPAAAQPQETAAAPPPVSMDPAPRQAPEGPAAQADIGGPELIPGDDPSRHYPADFVRVPFGDKRLKLDFPPSPPGFVQYIFNDWPGRIEEAQAAGYKFREDSQGKPMSRVVGVKEGGGPLYGYPMIIPEQWWKDDHARGQQRVDQVDEAIYGGHVAAGDDSQQRYIPEQGINIRSTQTGDPNS